MANIMPYRQKTALSGLDPFGDIGFFNSNFLRGLFGDVSIKDFRVDIKDKKDHLEIDAELPGMTKDQIDVSLEDGYLTITAQKDEETKTEEDGYVLNERRFGTYSRSFSVGDIKEDDISARYNDGVLKITLPKASEPEKRTRKIDIK